MDKRQCLPKKVRLLTSNEFTFVFRQPFCIKANGITLFSRNNQLGFPRIGLAISKKYVQHAHERNRIKRHIRETFRTNQHSLSATDFIITIHSKKVIHFHNRMLIRELKKLWYHHLC